MTEKDPFTRSTLFQRAVRRILRPLVRSLVAQGVMAPTFYQIVKEAYVEYAADELGAKANDSRISVMTGVHRRDVKSIRSAPDTGEAAFSRKVSTLATVVGRWISDPELNDPINGPIPLPQSSESGPSFNALVEEVSRDVRPRAVLEELMRQGVVTRASDMLHLAPEIVFGPADLDQKLHYFSHNLGDHMNAAVENLLNAPSPFMERAVFYNNLSEKNVTELDAEAKEKGAALLRDINASAAARQKADADDATALHRFRFGLYLYWEEDPASAGDDDETKGQTKA